MHRLSILGAAACLAVAAVTPAQARNVTLLSNFDPSGASSPYNDVWGYVAPDGREYAFLGADNGTYIVDCTNPAAPAQRAFISGPSGACCRDIRTYGTYAYVVADGVFFGGLQIIDMSDPDNPQLVNTWTGAFQDAHNVSIDTQTGTLYAVGTGQSPIVDLTADPVNPSQIGSVGGGYIHDMQVQDGFAHVARIFNSDYDILDVNDLSATSTLSSTGVNFAHNVWPTRDNNFAVVTTEISGESITIVDITNKRLPQVLTTWRAPPSNSLPHNAYLKDRVVHVSWYASGYRVVDLSDPPNPREVGFFDQSGGSPTAFTGNWGCYPFQPSGTIYLSDMQNGLYCVDAKARSVRFGNDTPGTGGVAPSIHAFGAAYKGNSNFALEMEDAQPSAAFVVLLGVGASPISVGGLNINIDLSLPFIAVPGFADASGNARIPIPMPASAADATLYAQFFAQDAAGAFNFAGTKGLRFEVFAP
ncbi:MAG: choice-of-anchor B family protein [Planctomycetota bacterium]